MRRNPHQIPGTLGGVGASRCEAALSERGLETRVVQRRASILVVKARVASARHARIWYRRVGTRQEANAVGQRMVAIVLARQATDMRIHLLNAVGRRLTPGKIDSKPRNVA